MTEAQAISRLESMLASDVEPLLTPAEVANLLALARRADEYGQSIDAPAWRPTYNLAAAAAEGWRWKAAKAAGGYTFSADGASFNRGEVYKHCLEMAATFASQSGITSVQLRSAQVPYVPYGVIGNV